MISQADLARSLGLSRAAVCKKVKAGMPLTSHADAEAWINANKKRAGKKIPELKLNNVEVEQPDEQKKEGRKLISQEGPEGRLERAKQAEMASYGLLSQAASENNYIAMRTAISMWGEAKRRVSEAEIENARHQQVVGKLIDINVAKEIFTKWMSAIRQALLNAPNAASARANPSDPECAKTAFEETINGILKTLTAAKNDFIK